MASPTEAFPPISENDFPADTSAHINQDGEEAVPTYTESDDSNFLTWISNLETTNHGLYLQLHLPLTQHPRPILQGYIPLFTEIHTPSESNILNIQRNIITSFFTALRTKNTELVTLLIHRGLVSPDVTDQAGQTPLIAAVDAGNATMVRTLLNLGAQVDSFGTFLDHNVKRNPNRDNNTQRTPLQVAAARGNLTIVRLLTSEYGANDALIAPDGQLALRLAAEGGHREVVEFLPLRRGGEWTRWKAHHAVAWRRIKRAASNIGVFGICVFYYLPKVFVWWIPKHCVVIPVRDASKWAWKNKGRFGRWCKKQVVEFPGRAKSVVKGAVKELWEGIKMVPKGMRKAFKFLCDVLKRIPGMARDVGLAIWQIIKAIPAALRIVGIWLWTSLKKISGAIASATMRVFSALHTMIVAIINFFQQITLKDVWDGLIGVLHAIFVELPKVIWVCLKAFGDVSYKVVGTLFGLLGKAFWWLVYGVLWVVRYVPSQIWVILCRLGGSIAKGFEEILVWFNPKR
jgi:hypothetical protein